MKSAVFHPACPCCASRLPDVDTLKCPRCRRSLPGPSTSEVVTTWLLEVFLPTFFVTGFLLYSIVALLAAIFGHCLIM